MNKNDLTDPGWGQDCCKPLMCAKLTKRLLMGLDAGFFIVSNVYDGYTRESATPVFAAPVAPAEGREEQWVQIKLARANGRLCNVFASPEQYYGWRRLWHAMAANFPRCQDCFLSDVCTRVESSGRNAANTGRV